MTRVLVLGAAGHTGSATVSSLLSLRAARSPRDLQVPAATRTPRAPIVGVDDDVRCDWDASSTFAPATRDIDAVYLLAPPLAPEPLLRMSPFFEVALRAGVKRFVLLGSSAIGAEDPGLGAVFRHLRDHAPAWVVLRPSWFMHNVRDLRNPLHHQFRPAGVNHGVGCIQGEMCFQRLRNVPLHSHRPVIRRDDRPNLVP